jgi:predicted CoA-binding protein
METMKARARRFLALPRFALVGVSRDEKSFSRAVLRELVRRGFDVVPVGPAAAEAELDGRRGAARVRDLWPAVDGAILMTPPGRTVEAVEDCLGAGVREIWMHRGAGPGAATPEAIAACRAAGVEPITGLCPFMALPEAGWFHGVHAFFRGDGGTEARAR